MQTTDLYINKADCCGCELCSVSCPKSVIHMKPDEEGFLYPLIESDENCINCKLCLKVCPEKTPGRIFNEIQSAYGGFVNETADLAKSASGGFATAINRAFINKMKGVVYGVAYSKDLGAADYKRVTTTEELESFRTSKYIQAHKGDIFKDILNDLRNGLKVLFIGLPCEVSAVYHKVGSESKNLYTVSLICHGPTSPKVQSDFITQLKQKNVTPITFFSVRYKLKGWKPYFIHAEYQSGRPYNKEFGVSDYGIAFQYLKRPSCSSCKYKYGNKEFGILSDVIIGDFHAVTKDMPHFNPMGVSEACVMTEQGKELISIIKDTCFVEPIPLEKVLTGNRALYESIPERKERQMFVTTYREKGLHEACSIKEIKYPIIKAYYSKKFRATFRNLLKALHLK